MVARAKIARTDALYMMDDDEIVAVLDELNAQATDRFNQLRVVSYFITAPYLKEHKTIDEFWPLDKENEPRQLTAEQFEKISAVADMAATLLSDKENGR